MDEVDSRARTIWRVGWPCWRVMQSDWSDRPLVFRIGMFACFFDGEWLAMNHAGAPC